MTSLLVYLDYNAAAPLRKAAQLKMMDVLSMTGNPASLHQYGRALSRILEITRYQIASLIGATASEIIFTSCASEANALVLQGARAQDYRLLVGATEHPSVIQAVDEKDRMIIPVDAHGLIQKEDLEQRLQTLQGQKVLVSLQAANGETGVCQPLDELIPLIKYYNAFCHVDGVQAVGRVPLNFQSLGCHALTLASNKIGGPAGAGSLILKSTLPLPALIRGGGQERYRRAGTPAVASLAGFGVALEEALCEDWGPTTLLRTELEQQLKTLEPHITIYGQNAPRLPNTTAVRLPNVRQDLQLMRLDLAGIAVSTGSACSSGKTAPSPVLLAMGASPTAAQETLRVSLGPQTSFTEIKRFLEAWSALIPQVHRHVA